MPLAGVVMDLIYVEELGL